MSGCQPRLHLPYGQWPVEDRRLWERAVSGDDPFGDAAGAHLAEASRKAYLFAWRRFLGFLAIEEPAALDTAPAERVTRERVRRFASHLADTNRPQSVAAQVDMLYKAARIVMPERDWTWLKTVKARLHAARPARGSAKPVITSVQLLELGLVLMDESRPTPGAPIRLTVAVRYRDGLMIALLAFIPLRRKNLAALEIGRHLVPGGMAQEDGVIHEWKPTKTRSPARPLATNLEADAGRRCAEADLHLWPRRLLLHRPEFSCRRRRRRRTGCPRPRAAP